MSILQMRGELHTLDNAVAKYEATVTARVNDPQEVAAHYSREVETLEQIRLAMHEDLLEWAALHGRDKVIAPAARACLEQSFREHCTGTGFELVRLGPVLVDYGVIGREMYDEVASALVSSPADAPPARKKIFGIFRWVK